MKVCVGGTFNYLHKGHRDLFSKAFEIAGKDGSVLIGLTSEEMTKYKEKIKSIIERKRILERYLIQKGYENKFIIKIISDAYGPTLSEDFDVMVVSPETKKTAVEINQIRKQKGKKSLKIVQIPFVLAKDGRPISSTRIINKEIDEDGNVLDKD